MPANLPEDAQAVWRGLAPDLLEANLLSSVDGPTFGLLCALIAHIDRCYAEETLPSRDVMSHFRALAKSFGLDPDARHKLALDPAPKPTEPNPFDDFSDPMPFTWESDSQKLARFLIGRRRAYLRTGNDVTIHNVVATSEGTHVG